MRSRRRCAPNSCRSRSSAPARPASSLPPSCTTRRGTLVSYGLDRIDPEKDMKLILIEAADRDPAGAAASDCRMRRPSCSRKLGVSVSHVRARRRGPAGWRASSRTARSIPAELVVWAAGVKAPDFLEGPRWAGDQPHQSAGRAADAADDARREHFRDRRLRRVPVAREGGRAGAAAGAVGAPAGVAHGEADPKRCCAGKPLADVALPRLRLAGLARRVLRRRAT